ncbi:MAG: hypothetical protein CBB97_15960 [Candidatus Endolissoclinum sp. TMED37]|nr:MAG: hypothetical protein CBB97_15960 [Candidatus Endolissoclinum sp. TMED37]
MEFIDIEQNSSLSHENKIISSNSDELSDYSDENTIISSNSSEFAEYDDNEISDSSNDDILSEERSIIEYSKEEKKIIELEKGQVLSQVEVNQLNKTSVIYPNQEECSKLIVNNLLNKKIIHTIVLALTQSGKTGCMIALIKNFIEKFIIPVYNIYIITGLSSNEWTEQTKDRVPEKLQKNIYHRNKLDDFVNHIKNKENVLVIMDEIQIAAKNEQTIYKSFQEAGFYDKEYLLKNDIKIVEFTATPDGTIIDIDDWGEHSKTIIMEPGKGYTSCFDLMNQNRIFQYKDLCGYNKKTRSMNHELVKKNINEIKEKIKKFKRKKYHIIRIPTDSCHKLNIVKNNFKDVFRYDDVLYIVYDQNDPNDINKYLEYEPVDTTFIFIKEKLRCAKTLKKEFLGILYDRYTNTVSSDSAIIQGLLGRGTGYDDNGSSIYFTNINTIKKYKELWKSKFTNKKIQWKSLTTKSKYGTMVSKNTYCSPNNVNGLESSSEIIDKPPVIQKFKSFNDAKTYVKNTLKRKRGPNKPKPNENGFYENYIRGKTSIMSTADVEKDKKWGINNNYRLHTCYRDITDKTTLEYWIIHYKLD